MKIDYKFRHTAPSDDIKDYVTKHITKLEKFELKPVRIEFTFSFEKSVKHVHVQVRGDDVELHAESDGDTFFVGIDAVLSKIGRQLAKKKARVQQHKGGKVS